MLFKSDFISLKEGDWSGLTGTGVMVESTTLRDGGTLRSPIIGDILATHHTDPQVCKENVHDAFSLTYVETSLETFICFTNVKC